MLDTLGDRMKRYEGITQLSLIPRTPVILRLDGKAFHTLTRGMERPYDVAFRQCMWLATRALCEEIQGVQLAYTQSDEISLLLVDYLKLNSSSWFEYNVQKVVSVSASIVTDAFRDAFRGFFPNHKGKIRFDSRCFNLSKEEVCNYFIWRQQDCVRNSITMAAQSVYSHKELHGVSSSGKQELLYQKGINWNDYETPSKRGACYIKKSSVPILEGDFSRSFWDVDRDIPTFSKDRNYIERFVYVGE